LRVFYLSQLTHRHGSFLRLGPFIAEPLLCPIISTPALQFSWRTKLDHFDPFYEENCVSCHRGLRSFPLFFEPFSVPYFFMLSCYFFFSPSFQFTPHLNLFQEVLSLVSLPSSSSFCFRRTSFFRDLIERPPNLRAF